MILAVNAAGHGDCPKETDTGSSISSSSRNSKSRHHRNRRDQIPDATGTDLGTSLIISCFKQGKTAASNTADSTDEVAGVIPTELPVSHEIMLSHPAPCLFVQ